MASVRKTARKAGLVTVAALGAAALVAPGAQAHPPSCEESETCDPNPFPPPDCTPGSSAECNENWGIWLQNVDAIDQIFWAGFTALGAGEHALYWAAHCFEHLEEDDLILCVFDFTP